MNNIGKGLIKEAVREVDEHFIVDKSKVNSDLDKALKNKYEKVNKDEKKYIELLRYNIIFYKSIIKKLESILEVWIQNDVIFSTETVDKSIENITDSSRKYVNNAMKNGNKVLNEKDKKIFLSYDKNTGFKRIEKIENDYKILNLYKDILGMVINVISLDVDKYSPILEMSTESAKIDIMNEIFNEINSILFTATKEKREFKDEALVDEEQVGSEELADEHKSMSFIKYVSMLSAPEVLVKINDVHRKTSEMEKMSEMSYLFSEEYKEYVSCVVLLMDYVSADNRRLFANTFRLFVAGKIGERQFKEIVERLVRDNTFMDKRTWLECQSIVKCDFNMENSNFFGESMSPDEDELSTTQYLRLVESFSGNGTIAEEVDSIYQYEDDEFDEDERPRKKLFGFAKFFNKIDTEDEDYDDEYYDDEEEEVYDEEYDEDYDEDDKTSFLSKIGSFFAKKDDEYEESDEEYDEEQDEEDVQEPYSTDEKFRSSQKEIQDQSAVAILKLRQKSENKENVQSKKELDKLKDERNIAENLKNNIMAPYFGNSDVFVKEEDIIYKNGVKTCKVSKAGDNEDIKKDSTKEDFTEENPTEEEFKELEDMISMTGEDKVRSKKLESKDIAKIESNKLNKSLDLEEDRTSNEPQKDLDTYEESEIEEDEDFEDDFEDTGIFGLKDKYDAFREKMASKKVERELKKYSKDREIDEFEYDEPKNIFSKKDSKNTHVLEDSEEDTKSKLQSGITSMFSKIKSDDEPGYTKGKIVRDSVIVIALMLVVFFGYTHVIKNFSTPSVSETNKTSQMKADKRSQDKTKGSTKDQGDEVDTKELAKKNSKIEEEDSITKQASELDRQADEYKNKGRYYTVFVGATKDKDGAESVSNNFKARGVNPVVVRNAGYYMLKVGEYFDYNQAAAESSRIGAKGIQNYISAQNKYYDLKIKAFETRIPKLTSEQLKTDYNDLKNQIVSSGKNAGYISNLDEIYEAGLKSKQ